MLFLARFLVKSMTYSPLREQNPKKEQAHRWEAHHDSQPEDRDITVVFQSYALYPHMTVGKI